MCGRFTIHSPRDFLAGRFDVGLDDLVNFAPRYNVAPTQDILTVRAGESARHAELMRWGLIPHWADDLKKLPLMINARVETVATKPAYRDSFAAHRCLIPANGFYEWKANAEKHGPKTPYFISLEDQQPFAMAGLWARRRTPDGESLSSCTIITAPANPALNSIHDRMPVILQRDAEAAWLDPDTRGTDALHELLTPIDSDQFRTRTVSTLVNSVQHDGPKLIEYAPDAAPSLF